MNVFKRFAALVAGALLGAPAVQAESYDATPVEAVMSSYEQRLSELETELVSLKSDDPHHEAAPGHHAPGHHAPGAIGGAGCGYQPGAFDACFDPCAQQGGFYAGFELVFIKPHFQNNQAYMINTAADPLVDRGAGFDWDFEPSPRVWIGFVGETGVGGRFRYWQFDHNANVQSAGLGAGDFAQAAVVTPGHVGTAGHLAHLAIPGDTITAHHGLDMQTADFEVTKLLNIWKANVTVAGGLRYMAIRQDYGVQVHGKFDGLQAFMLHQHSFEGAGPTLAVDVLRPIGTNGLSLYTNARGSVVVGRRSQNVYDHDVFLGDNAFQRRAREGVGIAEIGMGVQYGTEGFFARAGWEGQYWTGVGSPIDTTSDIALLGFGFGIGFNY